MENNLGIQNTGDRGPNFALQKVKNIDLLLGNHFFTAEMDLDHMQN